MTEAARSERKGARITKSRKHLASGSLWAPSEKADYDDETYLTEHKHTRYRTWRISRETWNTLVIQAAKVKKHPRLLVCFRPVAGIEYWWALTGERPINRGFMLHAEQNLKTRRGVLIERFSSS